MEKEKDYTLKSNDIWFLLDQWGSAHGVVAKIGSKEFNIVGVEEDLNTDGNIVLQLSVPEKEIKPAELHLVKHAVRNLKASTFTTFTQVVYKDRAIVSVTKTRSHTHSKSQPKYYYETTVEFVLNGKRWRDKATHRSLSKSLKYAHDIFVARNNNMIRNDYKLKEAK